MSSPSFLLTVVLCLLTIAAATPTTAPAIDPLIAQLGADSFKDRQAASEKLLKLGPRILPQLRQVKGFDDPEIDAGLREIIRKLEIAAQPPPPASGAIQKMLEHAAGHKTGIISARNSAAGELELSAAYGKDSVIMVRSAKGIEIELRCTINGTSSKETFRADSEADLRQQFPAAYQLHESLLACAGYKEDRSWWRQFATKSEPATKPAQ